MVRNVLLAHLSLLALFVLVGCLDPQTYRSRGTTARSPAAKLGAAAKTPSPAVKRRAEPTQLPPGGRDAAAALANNVAITIEKVGTATGAAMDASLAFRYANDRVAIGSAGGRLARRNGIRIGVATGSFRGRLGISARRSRRTVREQMFITVLSGQEGVIAVGTDTYVQRLGYWTPLGYEVLVERAFVGRSLVVRPRILGRHAVEVELWPRFTTRGRRGAIDLTELATKVVVPDGQSIVIGGLTTGGDDVGSVLFGLGRRTRTSTMTMILTPKIGGVPIEWPRGRW